MMKTLRVISVLTAALLLLPVACSKKKSTKPEPVKYKWTILGYFDGNNPQDQAPDGHSYVIKDVQELEQIGSTDSVQMVVMLGSVKTNGNCKYYHIEKHGDEPEDIISSPVLQDLGKKDMSDYTVLRDFIGYTVQNYGAEHYMLIVDDHGKGWRGICSDNVNGGGDWMTLPELSSALSGYQFDIIWFYSPSMATAEVAYQIRDRAEYLVASEFKNYPDNIMGSSYWLGALSADPMMNVRVFANKVVQGVQLAAKAISATKSFHSALIHLPEMVQLVGDLSTLSSDVIDSAGSYWSEVWDAWELSIVQGAADANYLDLREFARQIQNRPNLNSLIKSSASALEGSVNEAVLLELEHPLEDRTAGISIYLPWNQDYSDSVDYASVDLAATNWPEFVSVFTQTYLGNYAGALTVTSNITGAKIFLDGVDTGYEAPATIEGLFPRFYNLHLDKSGYCHYSTDPLPVKVFPHQTVSRYVPLHPCP